MNIDQLLRHSQCKIYSLFTILVTLSISSIACSGIYRASGQWPAPAPSHTSSGYTPSESLDELNGIPNPISTATSYNILEPTVGPTLSVIEDDIGRLTSTPEPTSPPPETFAGSISGKVFFDHNGDAVQEPGEPGIPAVAICLAPQLLHSQDRERCTYTEADGSYAIVAIPPGNYQITYRSPTSDPISAFRYLNISKGWVDIPLYEMSGIPVPAQRLPDTLLQSIEQPLEVQIKSTESLDVGLMQGYLTDTFTCADREKITHFQGFDLDPSEGHVRNYLGDTTAINFSSDGPNGTGDNHSAIDRGSDLKSIIGTPVIASAPGIVHFAGGFETWHGTCLMVGMVHPDTGHRSGYVHLNKILVKDGQLLKRGQMIGTLGMSCSDWPHLHFYFQPTWSNPTGGWVGVDPFRDTLDQDSFTYWTKDNEPTCPSFLNEQP